MRVLVNAHLLSSGANYRQAGTSRYIGELVSAMVRSDESVEWTICIGRNVATDCFPKRSNVRFIASRLSTDMPTRRIFWEQCIAPATIARERPDVIFCPMNVMPLLTTRPTVVAVLDLAFLRFNVHQAVKRAYLSLLTTLSVRRAVHVIAISEFTRSEVIKLLSVSPDRVTATLLGYNGAADLPTPSALDDFRIRHRLPGPFILFVGTLEPRKNIDSLIRAFALLKDQTPAILVVVGGAGWRFGPIFDLVKSLGLENRVRFEGFVSESDLHLYYAAAAVFAYPSIYEGFGLPPLEAMAAGTPVVTSNISSLPEVVTDSAILVTPTNVEELASAIKRLLSDESLREDLRVRGLVRSKELTWTKTAAATLNILRQFARN